MTERLESEVPLGAFLSGGIDSGLVVSFMAEALGRGVTTTSVGFGEAAHNELDAAGVTAARFETQHHVEIVEPRLDDVLDRIVGGFDEPFADASAIPTFHVAGMARRHVTVVLSGDGGDEAFGGYGFRYVPHALESVARSLLPGGAGAGGGGAGSGARWPRRRAARAAVGHAAREHRARSGGRLLRRPVLGEAAPGARSCSACRRCAIRGRSGVYDAVTEPYRRCPSTSAVQRAQYADLKIYLANDVLVKVDRMSMQHSLEVRCPLLDHRLIELAFRIPTDAQDAAAASRSTCCGSSRASGCRPELARLPKRGFSAPIAEWIAGPCASMFRERRLPARRRRRVAGRHVVRPAAVRRASDRAAPITGRRCGRCGCWRAGWSGRPPRTPSPLPCPCPWSLDRDEFGTSVVAGDHEAPRTSTKHHEED